MHHDLDLWFEQEILAHEQDLQRFIRRRVSGVDVWDVLQEVYMKVFADAKLRQYTSPSAFLFKVAKNYLTDCARRNCVVRTDSCEDVDSLNLLVDAITPERSASDQEELVRLKACLEKLSPQRREAVRLHKIEALSQKETADRLGVVEGTVEQHLVVAMRQVTRCFNSDPADAQQPAPRRISELGPEHGK